MGILDNLKRYVRGEDYEEDEMLEEEAGEESTQRWKASDAEEKTETARPSYERAARAERAESRAQQSGKVVSINTMTQLAVVLVKPERYAQAAEIADHLKEKRTIVLNLEETNRDVARRLLDFLSGAAYANGGKTTKVANSTYIITPYNVEIQGEQIVDELENNGLYV
ncbi:MAG: cell division protein SepF [Eubacteriales bacterium]